MLENLKAKFTLTVSHKSSNCFFCRNYEGERLEVRSRMMGRLSIREISEEASKPSIQLIEVLRANTLTLTSSSTPISKPETTYVLWHQT